MSEDELNWDLEEFDDSDANSYGGVYEEYDDLYDDVQEEAGYDIWDISLLPEFGFDEERYLFEYDPWQNIEEISYQAVVTQTEMLSKLLNAWKKRSKDNLTVRLSDDDFDKLNKNLYQLREKDRVKLRSYSVWKFLEVMGGEEEVEKFSEKIDLTLILTKKILSCVLSRWLPRELPYPAMRKILSHLMREDGLSKVGFMTSENDEGERNDERLTICHLQDGIASFYFDMRGMMFSYPSHTKEFYATNRLEPFKDKIERHLEDFEVVVQQIDSGEMVLFRKVVDQDNLKPLGAPAQQL